jgi:branched-chain amino acid transport system ATP-binding protein
MSAVLALAGVGKRFGSLHVLADVSFEVEAGERFGIIGPNGAGKSTLFNLIAGELAPSAGKVRLLGRDATRMSVDARARLGLARTFQATTLFPRLSVCENLLLALRSFGRRREERALVLLGHVGLEDRAKTPVQSLGYGERRQLELLLAIAPEPSILLLDEPTAGLAPADTTLVTEMLRREGGNSAIVLIEHDMGVVFDVVDRLMVLHHGRVVADGPVESIRGDATVQEIYLGGKL